MLDWLGHWSHVDEALPFRGWQAIFDQNLHWLDVRTLLWAGRARLLITLEKIVSVHLKIILNLIYFLVINLKFNVNKFGRPDASKQIIIDWLRGLSTIFCSEIKNKTNTIDQSYTQTKIIHH